MSNKLYRMNKRANQWKCEANYELVMTSSKRFTRSLLVYRLATRPSAKKVKSVYWLQTGFDSQARSSRTGSCFYDG